jgi:hypothetical protein
MSYTLKLKLETTEPIRKELHQRFYLLFKIHNILGKSSENPRLFNCRDESVSYPIKLLKKHR